MTITQSSVRFVSVIAGVALALALVAGVAAPAKALTQAEATAIITALNLSGSQAAVIQALVTGGGASTSGSGSCYAFTRALTMGSTGADVTALQQFLNSSASTQVAASGAGSAGMETSTFGALTKAAVVKFQTANGITPAAGYFGPITRAAVAAKCTSGGTGSTGGSSGSLEGGEGSLDVNGNLGDVESDVDEGDEDVNVLGVELEAQDSDIMLERVDVEITLSGTGSSQLDNYIEEISLVLDGETLGTMEVDEADEDDNDVFSFRFTGLDGVIEEDETGELYFVVTAVNNVDSGDVAKTLSIDVPANGVRAVDGENISETYVTAGEVTAETFNVTEETAGDLDISEGDNNPEDMVVQIDEDNDTDDVLVLAFDLESDNQDVTIDAIPVGLVATTDEVDGMAKRAILKLDGDIVDTQSIPSSATLTYQVLFDDLDIDLEDGETAEFEVYLDLNDADPTTFATGTTLYATTTGSAAAWDVEDSSGDDVTPGGSVSNASDGVLTFETEGITVTYVSSSATKSFEADAAGEQDVGTYTIVFDVTALDEDIYLDRTVTRDDATAGGSAGNGFMWATTTDSTVGTTTGGTASISVADSSVEFSAGIYKINSGSTERFTLTVLLDASDIDGYAAVILSAINWTTDSADATPDEFHTSGLDDLKTSNLNLNTI